MSGVPSQSDGLQLHLTSKHGQTRESDVAQAEIHKPSAKMRECLGDGDLVFHLEEQHRAYPVAGLLVSALMTTIAKESS